MITLSYANRLPVTIQCPYKKSITSERFCGRIDFEFDKCIACEVCVRVCPMYLSVVDWNLETDIRKKRLFNYIIDFGIYISCGNCVIYTVVNYKCYIYLMLRLCKTMYVNFRRNTLKME